MTKLIDEKLTKDIRTEDVLAKLCSYLYFIDIAVSKDTALTKTQLVHLGLLIDNMRKEIKTLAPFYEIVDLFSQDDNFDNN